MRVALVIICFLYIGILEFFMMDKLDSFISSDDFVKENPKDDIQPFNADAVVYIGRNVLPPDWSFKDTENLNVAFITDVGEICNESNFKYLFAFSRSDLENLTVCSMSKKRNDGMYAQAVCNDPKNKRLFDMLDVTILLREQFTPEYILSIIKPDVNRKVKLV